MLQIDCTEVEEFQNLRLWAVLRIKLSVCVTKIPLLLVGFRDLEKKSVTIGTNTLFVQREIPPFSLVTMRWPTLF